MEARKNARKYAVQAVFQLFFTKGDINKILEEFSEFRINDYDDGKFQYDKRFFKKIVNGVCENNKYIFELIEENLAKEWPLERIDITMQSIISLALFEIIKCPHTPIKVIINEYVSISRLYLNNNNIGFVNGILDKLGKELRSKLDGRK